MAQVDENDFDALMQWAAKNPASAPQAFEYYSSIPSEILQALVAGDNEAVAEWASEICRSSLDEKAREVIEASGQDISYDDLSDTQRHDLEAVVLENMDPVDFDGLAQSSEDVIVGHTITEFDPFSMDDGLDSFKETLEKYTDVDFSRVTDSQWYEIGELLQGTNCVPAIVWRMSMKDLIDFRLSGDVAKTWYVEGFDIALVDPNRYASTSLLSEAGILFGGRYLLPQEFALSGQSFDWGVSPRDLDTATIVRK